MSALTREQAKSSDWSYCPACGGGIDTGYECSKCGRDWLEFHETRQVIIDENAALRASLERCQDHQAHDTEEIVTLRVENERQQHRIHELENMESVYGVLRDQATIADLTAENERYQLEKQRMGAAMVDLRTQVTALEQERDDEAVENAQANEQTRQTLFEGIKTRDIKIQSLEQQLAAMTDKRDLIYRDHAQVCAENRTLTQQLAAVTDERDDWNKKHLSLCHVVIEVREQLAAMTEERDGFRQLAERLMARLPESGASLDWEALAKDALARHALLQQEVMALRIENDELENGTHDVDH